MKYQLLISLFLCLSISSSSQVIKGKVIDSLTSKPIPYAHLIIQNSNSGSIANSEGFFEISVSGTREFDVIIVSAIGYHTKQFNIDNNETFLTISLDQNAYSLDEVVIEYKTPETIFCLFHERYKDNYYQGSVLLDAYYRTTFKENNKYVNFLEATTNIREFSKKGKRSFEVEISQQRKSNDYRKENWSESGNYLYQTIASNPLLELSDFLDVKNLKYYNIRRLDNTTFDDKLVYVIKFVPLETSKTPLYDAVIYINSVDFALIKAEYVFNNNRLKIKNLSYNQKQIHTSYVVGSLEYHKVGDWYFPLYISGDTGFEIISEESGDTLVKNVLLNEILFSKVDTNYNEKFENKVRRHGDVYSKPSVYDPDYWNKQVSLSATRLYLEAMEDLSQHQNIEIQYLQNSASDIYNQSFEPTLSGKIDSVLTLYHLTDLFNGVALVTNNNKIIHHQAYGYSDIESKKELTTSSLFDIGSTTKQFTAAIILKLKEQGKLELNDSVDKYLPWYRHGNKITIHQLLSHTSGIPTFDYDNLNYDASWFSKPIVTDEFIQSFCSGELEFIPGSKMEYSNSNYLILTSIIEHITGEDYYYVLEEMVFDPLEMNASYRPDSLPTKNTTTGYIFNNSYTPEPDWAKANMKGVGCIYSTSEDLLKWVTSINNSSLLNPESTSLMKYPHVYYEHYDADFGYSWAINKSTFNNAETIYFYGGTSLGYYSMITTIPESGITIILLNNTGSFPRIEITKEILQLFDN